MTDNPGATQGSRLLVSGATGFLGRPLCQNLQQAGWPILALNRRDAEGPWDEQHRFELAQVDLPESVFIGVQAIIHLAGLAHTSGSDTELYHQLNTQGTLRLAEQALARDVRRFIYISSSQAADALQEGVTADAYPKSKYAAELGLQQLAQTQGLALTVLRPTLVYGAGVKANLKVMLRAIARGWMPPLPETDGGVSMIARADFIAAVIAVLRHDRTIGQTYTLDDGVTYNPTRIYRATRHALGQPVPDWSVPYGLLKLVARLGDMSATLGINLPLSTPVLDKLFANTASHSDALFRDTGWSPRHSLEDQLPSMLSEL